MASQTIECSAPAKVNLALAVGPPIKHGPRAGYHPIASWMSCIDLVDELRVTRLGADETTVHDLRRADGAAVAWDAAQDLAVRAHQALERCVERRLPAAIELIKHIPDQAGLGGGSSDAASVLLALRDLFDLDLGTEQLQEVAMTLGSDIAYFIDDDSPPRPAIVEGLGERITRTARLDQAITLFIPEVKCATGAVYRELDREPARAKQGDSVRRLAEVGTVDAQALFNDLTAPAERVEPDLATLRSRLSASLARPVHMTGSGSALFALGKPRAETVPPGVRVIQTRLI